MPDSDQRQYQNKAFLELTHIIQTQKIPNALLFSGDENSQRKEAALFFAKGCNCLEKSYIACNTCKSCRKIDAHSHPDILTIDLEKDKKIISIAQIRKMGLAISSRPNEARYRMVLILNSDKMNPQAQNALLKMLEEPPEKTFFILIAKDTNLLLPTIISRCSKIRFKPLSPKLIEQTLIKDFKINRQMAYIAARTANSDLKKAMLYLNLNSHGKMVEKTGEIDWIKKRKYLLRAISDIIQTDTNLSVSKGLMLSKKISLDSGMLDDTIAIMK
ncbi:MAG: DNA polymerase III subunit delta', partial [Desulfobacula sp.]|nr:DNA polymerase III subunit delta' [Desulfobacula sp.]